MKKIIVLLLVLILTLSAAACGGSKAPADNTASQSNGSSAVESKSDSADASSGDTGTATKNTQDFTSLVESTLTVSDYNKEVSKLENGQKVVYSKKAEIGKPNFDVTIDGYHFTMPVKYTDLIEAGWTDTKNLAEESLDKDSIASTTFTTSAGKSVVFSFITDGNETVKIKETKAVKMEIKNATTDKAATIDPPSFTILGSVKNNTDLKGILQAAAPSNVSIWDYNESGTAVESTVKYSNGDDNVEIKYLVGDNTIESVKMEYGVANTIISY